MMDDRFSGSVVFLCAHSGDGAMGIVINRLAPGVTLSDILEQLSIDCDGETAGRQVLSGGPVEQERGFVKSQSDLWIVGSPDTVKAKIMEKVDETNADEVMVSTTIHDYDKRLESYRLLKEAWDA